jgi:hypothetical protein
VLVPPLVTTLPELAAPEAEIAAAPVLVEDPTLLSVPLDVKVTLARLKFSAAVDKAVAPANAEAPVLVLIPDETTDPEADREISPVTIWPVPNLEYPYRA